jgi:hypothetical protein
VSARPAGANAVPAATAKASKIVQRADWLGFNPASPFLFDRSYTLSTILHLHPWRETSNFRFIQLLPSSVCRRNDTSQSNIFVANLKFVG